jgi:hypothetical protein
MYSVSGILLSRVNAVIMAVKIVLINTQSIYYAFLIPINLMEPYCE